MSRAGRPSIGIPVPIGRRSVQQDDLEALLRSRVPLIAVESRDGSEVLKALTRACARVPAGKALAKTICSLGATTGLPLFQWTVTDGLKRLDIDVFPSGPSRLSASADLAPLSNCKLDSEPCEP